MRQGNDSGSEYRSVIFVRDHAQKVAAEESKKMYQQQLNARGYGEITTEIVGPPAPPFYFAEDYHQQYLKVNPHGYCPNHSTGIRLPDGWAVMPLQYAE
jgi:peptide-methionine (S)-S-oxide reductase